ncbi:hypothetical protein L6452_40757 [Arctium lappa]|uniref:Uncharacterized protein n=1 Tax=Arctium lappa TaxID=4217 RepID=A0ACB8XMS9_ARCLA|nr:hypothetical protein L6452_40757 [Arctium lappa]
MLHNLHVKAEVRLETPPPQRQRAPPPLDASGPDSSFIALKLTRVTILPQKEGKQKCAWRHRDLNDNDHLLRLTSLAPIPPLSPYSDEDWIKLLDHGGNGGGDLKYKENGWHNSNEENKNETYEVSNIDDGESIVVDSVDHFHESDDHTNENGGGSGLR